MLPLLFNVYMDVIMRKVTEGEAGGVMVEEERVVDLDFAYDVALLVDTWLVLVAMVILMEQANNYDSLKAVRKISMKK